MAKKPIIEIDIDDAKFQSFYALFKEYETKVGDQKKAWEQLESAIGKADATMQSPLETAHKIPEELKKATTEMDHFGTSIHQSGRGMKAMLADSERVAKSIFGIGKFLLKMGVMGIGAAAGGLFGLDALANSAMSRQRGARGMNVTAGELAGFKTNMSRFVNPDAILESSASMPTDVGLTIAAQKMGLSPGTLRNESTIQRSFDIINKSRDIWERNKNNPLATSVPEVQGAMAFGLTPDAMRRLANTHKSTLLASERQVGIDSRKMGFNDSVAKEWALLAIQFHRSGVMIETVLIKGLAKLAPEFNKLSKEFTSWFSVFVQSGEASKYIEKFKTDLKEVADFVGSSAFKKDMERFGQALGDLTEAVIWAAGKLGWLIQSASTSGTDILQGSGPIPKGSPMDRMMHPGGIISDGKNAAQQVADYAKSAGAGKPASSQQAESAHADQGSLLRHLRSLTKPRLGSSQNITINNKASNNVSVSVNGIAH